MRGIAFCAVGEGLDSWDVTPPASIADVVRLERELLRVPITIGDMRYVDATGATASTPTHRLQLTVTVTAPSSAIRLREFALVGGDATPVADSGQLVNYVIHPRIELAPRATLTRTIRLSFRPGGGSAHVDDLLELPAHWLADESVEAVDGVGAKVMETLRALDVATIGALASADPPKLSKLFSGAKSIELRSKARLALRTAAALLPVPSLEKIAVRDILAGDAASLPGALAPLAVDRLHEQLALLQLSLDARLLARTTLGDLTRTR
jgi:hypothetical protein